MKLFRIIPLIVLCLLAGWAAAYTAGDDGYQHPIWRIAKLAKPPVIDGVIHPEEYAGVPAITGMVTYGEDKSIVAEMQEVVWYVGYDDQTSTSPCIPRIPKAPGPGAHQGDG